jgi:hypothetical protein
VLRGEETLAASVEVKEERAYHGKLEAGHIHHPPMHVLNYSDLKVAV